MRTYEEVVEKVRSEDGLAPEELGEAKEFLSGEYAFVASELEKILRRKPKAWEEIRKTVQSDARADRSWDGTEDGNGEIIYRLRLKAIEKLMSSISSRLRIMEGEARSQF